MKEKKMKTGTYIYSDGTYSEKIDKTKTIAGILCNVTDTHEIAIMPVESEEKLNFDEAQQFCQAEGGRCPTIDELTGIYLNKDKINAALKAANLPELKESWYWSSTEGSSLYAWHLWLDNSFRSYGTKTDANYVRPVFDIPVKSQAILIIQPVDSDIIVYSPFAYNVAFFCLIKMIELP